MVLPIHSRHLTRALSCTHLNSRCLVGTFSPSTPIPGKHPPSSPPPNVEYKWPFPDFRKSQKYWELKSRILCFLVGMGGRSILTIFNRTKVHNRDILIDAVFKRPPGVPLITVANHESCMDDPGLFALSPKQLADQKNMRWSLAAHDICFTKSLHSWFFSHGKCIPVVRGLGVYQKPVDFAIDRLNNFGDWLHIFPEGKVNMERIKLYRLKWGVGRIISELKTTPLVIPFHHTGMADVLPTRQPYIPRIGKNVFINVGPPLNIQPLLDSIKDFSPHDKRKAITDFIQAEMEKLRQVTLKLAEEYRSGKLKC